MLELLLHEGPALERGLRLPGSGTPLTNSSLALFAKI
jgi:hypothetical protein